MKPGHHTSKLSREIVILRDTDLSLITKVIQQLKNTGVNAGNNHRYRLIAYKIINKIQ